MRQTVKHSFKLLFFYMNDLMWLKIKSFCDVTKAIYSHTWLNVDFGLYFHDNAMYFIYRFSLIWSFNIGEIMHINA